MEPKIRITLEGTYEFCYPLSNSAPSTPFLKYRAIGYTLCEKCLRLDRVCFETSEAIKIEQTLTCSCPHVWDAYMFLNNTELEDELTPICWDAGISISRVPCPQLCSSEVLLLAQKYFETQDALWIEQEKLNHLINAPKRPDISSDEVLYCHNVRYAEAEPYLEVERQANNAKRKFFNHLTNLLRDTQGLPHVGEGWVNETRMFRIVQSLFPDDEVVHHYRAPWLGRLELDVYIESKNIGFEYQGIQHYEPQEHWGGIEALEKTMQRDAEKVSRCKAHKTTLIEIYYNEELCRDLVIQKLADAGLYIN